MTSSQANKEYLLLVYNRIHSLWLEIPEPLCGIMVQNFERYLDSLTDNDIDIAYERLIDFMDC